MLQFMVICRVLGRQCRLLHFLFHRQCFVIHVILHVAVHRPNPHSSCQLPLPVSMHNCLQTPKLYGQNGSLQPVGHSHSTRLLPLLSRTEQSEERTRRGLAHQPCRHWRTSEHKRSSSSLYSQKSTASSGAAGASLTVSCHDSRKLKSMLLLLNWIVMCKRGLL